eukprot:2309020-Pyramimonas_sp.AAC.1
MIWRRRRGRREAFLARGAAALRALMSAQQREQPSASCRPTAPHFYPSAARARRRGGASPQGSI